MPEDTKTYPVVNENGVPLVSANGDPIMAAEPVDATTSDGRPAVRASADNTPHDAHPDPNHPAASASDDHPTAPQQAAPGSSPAAADTPVAPQNQPEAGSASGTSTAQTAPASTAPAAPVPTASDAPPASQGSGAGATPPPQGTASSADAAQSSNGGAQPAPAGSVGTAQANDDPATPNSVSASAAAAPSTETINPALTTTVDATTIAKAKAEQDAGATAANTPAQVLGSAVAAATPAVTAPAADGSPAATTPLVVAPGTADGIAVAAANGGVTQEGVTDVGHKADTNTAASNVVTAPSAAGNGASDGPNAGAVSPTGYIAPVRVSAAGVPADDPTLAAAASGDLTVTDLTKGSAAPASGVSQAPDPTLPSQGVDATSAGTQGRLGGGAQNDPNSGTAAPVDRNSAAQTQATIAAMTGSPSPASVNDTTLAHPTAAGDSDAAGRVSDLHGQDAPAATPAPSSAATPGATTANGSTASAPAYDPAEGAQPLKPQTPADAAAVLTDAGALPAPVAADVTATVEGPQKVSDLDTSKGTEYTVTHLVETETHYVVYAASIDEAVAAVKRGEGVKTLADAHDEWDAVHNDFDHD